VQISVIKYNLDELDAEYQGNAGDEILWLVWAISYLCYNYKYHRLRPRAKKHWNLSVSVLLDAITSAETTSVASGRQQLAGRYTGSQ
jgi:hypothetical protein